MKFLSHTAKNHRFATASSGTPSGHGDFAPRGDNRSVVAPRLQPAVAAASQGFGKPGDNTHSYLAGDPWRGSGP